MKFFHKQIFFHIFIMQFTLSTYSTQLIAATWYLNANEQRRFNQHQDHYGDFH